MILGHFDSDHLLDLAVANFGNYPSEADFGNVRPI